MQGTLFGFLLIGVSGLRVGVGCVHEAESQFGIVCGDGSEQHLPLLVEELASVGIRVFLFAGRRLGEVADHLCDEGAGLGLVAGPEDGEGVGGESDRFCGRLRLLAPERTRLSRVRAA